MKSIKKQFSGFTLVELMVSVAIVGIIAVFAVGQYRDYVLEMEYSKCFEDLTVMALEIDGVCFANGACPADLAAVNLDGNLDPWGSAYRYHNIVTGGIGPARKYRNQAPINSDYDLYCIGPDQLTATPLTNPRSDDDVLRVNNGRAIKKGIDL